LGDQLQRTAAATLARLGIHALHRLAWAARSGRSPGRPERVEAGVPAGDHSARRGSRADHENSRTVQHTHREPEVGVAELGRLCSASASRQLQCCQSAATRRGVDCPAVGEDPDDFQPDRSESSRRPRATPRGSQRALGARACHRRAQRVHGPWPRRASSRPDSSSWVKGGGPASIASGTPSAAGRSSATAAAWSRVRAKIPGGTGGPGRRRAPRQRGRRRRRPPRGGGWVEGQPAAAATGTSSSR